MVSPLPFSFGTTQVILILERFFFFFFWIHRPDAFEKEKSCQTSLPPQIIRIGRESSCDIQPRNVNSDFGRDFARGI